jgi:ABC-type multidrug transport system ATPase subunit
VADRVAILKSGRIVWHGLLEDLKEQTHVSLEDSFWEMHNQQQPIAGGWAAQNWPG